VLRQPGKLSVRPGGRKDLSISFSNCAAALAF
jgi:hypothetical protein